jgi:hypothetical protein
MEKKIENALTQKGIERKKASPVAALLAEVHQNLEYFAFKFDALLESDTSRPTTTKHLKEMRGALRNLEELIRHKADLIWNFMSVLVQAGVDDGTGTEAWNYDSSEEEPGTRDRFYNRNILASWPGGEKEKRRVEAQILRLRSTATKLLKTLEVLAGARPLSRRELYEGLIVLHTVLTEVVLAGTLESLRDEQGRALPGLLEGLDRLLSQS